MNQQSFLRVWNLQRCSWIRAAPCSASADLESPPNVPDHFCSCTASSGSRSSPPSPRSSTSCKTDAVFCRYETKQQIHSSFINYTTMVLEFQQPQLGAPELRYRILVVLQVGRRLDLAQRRVLLAVQLRRQRKVGLLHDERRAARSVHIAAQVRQVRVLLPQVLVWKPPFYLSWFRWFGKRDSRYCLRQASSSLSVVFSLRSLVSYFLLLKNLNRPPGRLPQSLGGHSFSFGGGGFFLLNSPMDRTRSRCICILLLGILTFDWLKGVVKNVD